MTKNKPNDVTIVVDDLQGPEIKALLQTHLTFSAAHSPMESMHALDIDALRQDDITLWTAWRSQDLVGCIALKDLGAGHGEIKSMHTAETARGQGIGRRLLDHLMREAHARSYQRLSLETGTLPAFEPARLLYAQAGFQECPPFADYNVDPYSVFMTLAPLPRVCSRTE